jgi:hypothetical protein
MVDDRALASVDGIRLRRHERGGRRRVDTPVIKDMWDMDHV